MPGTQLGIGHTNEKTSSLPFEWGYINTNRSLQLSISCYGHIYKM